MRKEKSQGSIRASHLGSSRDDGRRSHARRRVFVLIVQSFAHDRLFTCRPFAVFTCRGSQRALKYFESPGPRMAASLGASDRGPIQAQVSRKLPLAQTECMARRPKPRREAPENGARRGPGRRPEGGLGSRRWPGAPRGQSRRWRRPGEAASRPRPCPRAPGRRRFPPAPRPAVPAPR